MLVNLSGRGDKDVHDGGKSDGVSDERYDVRSRIATTFERLKAESRTGLVTYMTAGDPDLPRIGARSCRRSTAPAPTCSKSACRFPIRWPTAR